MEIVKDFKMPKKVDVEKLLMLLVKRYREYKFEEKVLKYPEARMNQVRVNQLMEELINCHVMSNGLGEYVIFNLKDYKWIKKYRVLPDRTIVRQDL